MYKRANFTQATSNTDTTKDTSSNPDLQDLMGNQALLEQMETDQAEGPETLLGTAEAPANLTPGIMYSNTSTSRLNDADKSVKNWAAQGYQHSNMYTLSFTLSELAEMGSKGQLQVGSGQGVDREYNLIDGPFGKVEQVWDSTTNENANPETTDFILRGGKDVGENRVELTVANNGCLNLHRLAEACDAMVRGWGLGRGPGGQLDYGEGNYEAYASMTMGNDIKEGDARDAGMVAGIENDLSDRVQKTLAAVTAAATMKASAGSSLITNDVDSVAPGSNMRSPLFHPGDSEAIYYRGDKWAHAKLDESFSWVDQGEVPSRGNGRIHGIWLESGEGVKNSWFAEAPDFTSILSDLEVPCSGGGATAKIKYEGVKNVQEAFLAIGNLLAADASLLDPVFLDLAPGVKSQYIKHYQNLIRQEFKKKANRAAKELQDRQTRESRSHSEPLPPDPNEGLRNNVEGGSGNVKVNK